ncbi:MAG: cupin-like domain-containing protein [Novosphingobium sp.]
MIWIGPGGTFTPLHHDLTNNLLVQVAGRKQVILLLPADTPNLHNDVLFGLFGLFGRPGFDGIGHYPYSLGFRAAGSAARKPCLSARPGVQPEVATSSAGVALSRSGPRKRAVR